MIFVPTSKAFIVNCGACKCILLCIFSAITYFLFSQVLFFQTTNFSFSGAIFVLSFFQFVKLFRCAVSSVFSPRTMRLTQRNRCRADFFLPVGFSQRSFIAFPLKSKPLRYYLLIPATFPMAAMASGCPACAFLKICAAIWANVSVFSSLCTQICP